MQLAPPVPQALLRVPATQVPVESLHPVVQVVAAAQAPDTQAWPVPQAAHA